MKYGYPIGIAQVDIEEGQWVHTHNLSTGLTGVLEYTYQPDPAPTHVNIQLRIDTIPNNER